MMAFIVVREGKDFPAWRQRFSQDKENGDMPEE